MPDFLRLTWVSDAARSVWEPRLRRLAHACRDIEWMSIAAGIRSCAVAAVSPEDFVLQAALWAKRGLCALPLEIQRTAAPTSRKESPLLFRIVLGRVQDVSELKDALEANDHESVGRFLGTPSCCHEFLTNVWVDGGIEDTTWPMALATSAPAGEATSIEVSGSPHTNVLWRWIGVRSVPHLPCRFDCSPSIQMGESLIQVGRDLGYAEEMDWLLEILSWPVEWSALHGIAEIKTPILKISTRTDATERKYLVSRRGESYPQEGARGLKFPYSTPQRPRFTSSKGFRRGLDHPIPRRNAASEVIHE